MQRQGRSSWVARQNSQPQASSHDHMMTGQDHRNGQQIIQQIPTNTKLSLHSADALPFVAHPPPNKGPLALCSADASTAGTGGKGEAASLWCGPGVAIQEHRHVLGCVDSLQAALQARHRETVGDQASAGSQGGLESFQQLPVACLGEVHGDHCGCGDIRCSGVCCEDGGSAASVGSGNVFCRTGCQ